MPSHELPDGYPSPDTLVRDLKWNLGWPQGWPEMFLRSVYDIMESEFRVGRGNRGSPRIAFVKAFNVSIMTMTRKAHPRRATVADGKLMLTPEGVKINSMYAGKKAVKGKPGSYIMKRYGKKSPADMKLDYNKKMRKLAILLEMLRSTLADNMPNQSPARTS